jgi:uncharacterized protein YabE (DUF348 family)
MKISTLTAIVLVALLVAGAAFAVLSLRAEVTVTVDGEPQSAAVWAWTVGDALAAMGVPVTEGDVITPAVESRLPADGQIRVERATWVVIAADGETRTLWTAERAPARLLEAAGVALHEGDTLLWNGTPLRTGSPRETITLQVRRGTRVTLRDADGAQTFTSGAGSLGESLWEQGIALHNGDRLRPASATPLRGGEISAELQRSFPVTIRQSGGSFQARVLAETVGEALAQAGVPLQGLDYSIPPEDAPIPISRTLRVVRVREEVILETEPLPFGSLTQPLPDLEIDNLQVVQVGEYGLTARRVRVRYEDGVETARQTEEEWVARAPKPRIVGYGTKIVIRTLNTPDGPIEYWRAVRVYASTYSPCHSGQGRCDEITSSGEILRKGIIAVTLDWYRYMKFLPVYVDNYGFGKIADVGGGLPDRHWIDLGYSEEDFVGWAGWTTIYFLTPVPENVLWILP